ncbi:hypothetical protein LTR47_011338 [Exophiala xenobiotica]|nr:hypothetical protein LTR47_011338 [Exophiala xenobiotica]KAK5244438.1 hypothetical protein LTS06_009985 [Exophiala xenobiotica]KAK5282553.1 hypothetical protein LTR40_003134 [Exophiala xenobiotica]KAK5332656.1 hypothetical protein LTR98_011217 [Exophiala xenobiotica]KAK5469956.1 hypothetical protein LTR55_011278 [Exophiala xenobiotica]
MIAMGDMINATENNQVCLVYGDRWRLHRRLMHTAVGSQAVRPLRHIQAYESQILVRDLMEKPDDYPSTYNDTLPHYPKRVLKLPKTTFAKRLYNEKEKNGLDDAEIATLTSNLIGGGVDTTSGTTIAFLLAMCAFPNVQQKAHEELDKVVGQDRVPDWNDENSLPYVKAVVSEVLRWRTVTILGGIPHAPIQDDDYRGYFIPKGTPITGNVWAIHRNPRDFPDPDVFRPERFYGGLERPYPNKQGHNAFGWGRRVCSGQPLAEQGLFMTIATLLWAFDIRPGLDENGNELNLDTSIDAYQFAGFRDFAKTSLDKYHLEYAFHHCDKCSYHASHNCVFHLGRSAAYWLILRGLPLPGNPYDDTLRWRREGNVWTPKEYSLGGRRYSVSPWSKQNLRSVWRG